MRDKNRPRGGWRRNSKPPNRIRSAQLQLRLPRSRRFCAEWIHLESAAIRPQEINSPCAAIGIRAAKFLRIFFRRGGHVLQTIKAPSKNSAPPKWRRQSTPARRVRWRASMRPSAARMSPSYIADKIDSRKSAAMQSAEAQTRRLHIVRARRRRRRAIAFFGKTQTPPAVKTKTATRHTPTKNKN